ncbi:MAG: (2Fe-2S) ferredoxin domain-containing protein [Spartobacteria bacterium]|nr:(2Fe-2S) ferredoxin domain-containing protein [Spartobacteria bacterium]
MTKLTLEDLRKRRDEKKKEMQRREPAKGSVEVIIGMGTCGIAAGAKEAFDAFLDELDKNDLGEVVVKQTGCMGLCYSEPTVEIRVPDMPDIIYGNVNDKVARDIVRTHIKEKKLVDDHIYDKPAADIVG